MTDKNSTGIDREPDGIVRGPEIDFYFWLGDEAEQYQEATPEEIEAVDAMFDDPDGEQGESALLGDMDQSTFDFGTGYN